MIEQIYNSLVPYQKKILTSKKRVTVTIASTKAGKTYSHLVWLIIKFVDPQYRHKNFWWVAPVYSQAKIAFQRMQRALAQDPNFKFNKSELSITYFSKRLYFKSADNFNSLYGDDVVACVFDEFTRATPDSYYAIRSTLTKTKGYLKMIGNYTGESNWGVRLAEEMKNNPEWAFFKITAIDAVEAGILDSEEVEQARRDLPSEIFDSLYLAKGGYDKDRLIQAAALNDLFTNSFVPEGKRYLTADIAMQGSDLFVIMVWSGLRLLKVFEYPKTKGNEVVQEIRHLAETYKVPQSNIIFDADGIGSYLSGYLPDATPFNGNRPAVGSRGVYMNRKAQIHYVGAASVNRSDVYILPDALTASAKTRLIKELSAVKRDKSDKDGTLKVLGKDKVKEAIGHSPDYADAFFMRFYAEVMPRIL